MIAAALLGPTMPFHPSPVSMTTAATAQGFAYSREQFQRLVEDVCACAQGARRQRGRRRSVRGVRTVGVGAQGRARERRAQPRQVDRHHAVRRPAARQCQQLRLLARRRSSRRCAPPTTSPASRPRIRRPGCPRPRTSPRRRRRRATSICSIPGRSMPTRRSSSRAAARPPRSPPIGGSPTPRAPACRRSSRTSGPATAAASAAAMRARATRSRWRRLRARRRHAARRLVQLDARRRASCVAGGSGPLCRRARTVAAALAQGPDLRSAGAVRVAAGGGAGRRLVQATSGGALYRKASFPARQPRQAGDGRRISTSTRIRINQGARPAHRSTTKACARADAAWSMAAWCRATSCRAIRRASSACAPPAMPAARRTCALTSRLTQPGDDLDAMMRKLDRGLFVTELMGQGVNYVTGDYSRGAAGFWVERGASRTRCTRSRSPATCAPCCRARGPRRR